MRFLALIVGLALVGCTSATAPVAPTTACWVNIPTGGPNGAVLHAHYAVCPSAAELDAIIGKGKYWVTPG